MYDLQERVKSRIENNPDNDIIVEFEANELTNVNFHYIANLSQILANDEQLEIGEFYLDIFEITIKNLKTYEKENIINSSN